MIPLVSILVPAFNAERWIAETIASARAQTWPAKEIIVVDDGSTDRTLDIARRFTGPELSVVSQPRTGAAAARNRALSLCRGDYIQWLDADDLLAPDKVARRIDALRARPAARLLLSGAWGRFVYRAHKAQFVPSALWEDLAPGEWLVRKLGDNLYMPISSWLVSRDLCDAAGAWDSELSADDDGEYFCRVLLASTGTHFVPEARAFYRRTGANSLSHVDASARKLASQLHSMERHIASLRSLDDGERARRACLRYLQTGLILFFPEHPEMVERCTTLADELGGSLETPHLPWKYTWIQKTFGWRAAKRTRLAMSTLRAAGVRLGDRIPFELERCLRASRRVQTSR